MRSFKKARDVGRIISTALPRIFVLSIWFTSGVHAADAKKPIVFETVVAKMYEQHPLFRSQQLNQDALRQRVEQSRFSMPVESKIELANFAGTGNSRAFDHAEATFSVIKMFEWGGKLSARSNVAERELDVSKTDQDREKLDLLAQTAQRFIVVLLDQHRLQIADEKLTMQKHLHDIVNERVTSGRSHTAESRKSAIAIARAEIEMEHAEHELLVARVLLAASWGDTKPDFGEVRGDLLRLDAPMPFEQLAKRLEKNPDLTRYMTEERLAHARMLLAQKNSLPNIELGVGVRYFNQSTDGAFVLSASMPLGTTSRAEPAIAEQRLLAEREKHQYQTRYLELYTTLFDLYQEMLHARTAFEILRERIIPEGEKAAQSYEQAFRSGRLSLLELVDVQKSLLEARMEVINAAANFHRLRIELERLTGTVISTGDNS